MAVNLARSSTNRTPSRSESDQHNGRGTALGDIANQVQKTSVSAQEMDRARTADSIAIGEPHSANAYRNGRQRESNSSAGSAPQEQKRSHGYVHVTQRTLAAAVGVKVRGSQLLKHQPKTNFRR